MQDEVFKFEIKRKLFHLCSLIFPIMYTFTPKIVMSAVLFIIMVFTLYLDISRHYNPKIKVFVDKIFGNFLRTSEKEGIFSISGTSYMAAGFFLLVCFFQKALLLNHGLF